MAYELRDELAREHKVSVVKFAVRVRVAVPPVGKKPVPWVRRPAS